MLRLRAASLLGARVGCVRRRVLLMLLVLFRDAFHHSRHGAGDSTCKARGLLGHSLLRLLLARWLIGGGELLPVERDLGDAHGGKGLAVSRELLVLLFALEVEDEDLVRAALFDRAADHARTRLRTADLALLPADGEHVGELDLPVRGGGFLDLDHVPGCDAILLSPGANDRVHTIASDKDEALLTVEDWNYRQT